jgi:hypothetical protein
VDTTRPLCGWCQSSLSCQPTTLTCAAPGHLTDVGNCPTITNLAPTKSTVAGNETVTFVVSSSPVAGTVECKFGPATSIATLVSGTTYTCLTPPSGAPQDVLFTVLVNGNEFAGPKPFSYYACNTATTCGTCINQGENGACAWCGASCIPKVECTSPPATCPRTSIAALYYYDNCFIIIGIHYPSFSDYNRDSGVCACQV